MARGINKVILVGNLGKDPEVTYTPSGQSLTKFSLATSRSYKDKTTGEFKEETDWHNIVAWGKTGDSVAKYLSKGRQVYVEGRIQNRSWEDKEGNKRYFTDIVVDNIMLLGGRGDGPSEPQERPAAVPRSTAKAHADDFGGPGHPDEITDDDIPF